MMKIKLYIQRNTGKYSSVVFRSDTSIPSSLVTYVKARENHFFKPYKTYFIQTSPYEICLVQEFPLYRNNLKDREFSKKRPQNFDPEQATIAERQGASEDQNFEGNATKEKTDFSGCFGIEAPLRETLRDFQRQSKQTHRLLYEIALEEHTEKAHRLFTQQPV